MTGALKSRWTGGFLALLNVIVEEILDLTYFFPFTVPLKSLMNFRCSLRNEKKIVV